MTNYVVIGILAAFIVLLLVLQLTKKKIAQANYPHFFGGVSKGGFFCSNFDNMKWAYGRKKE